MRFGRRGCPLGVGIWSGCVFTLGSVCRKFGGFRVRDGGTITLGGRIGVMVASGGVGTTGGTDGVRTLGDCLRETRAGASGTGGVAVVLRIGGAVTGGGGP